MYRSFGEMRTILLFCTALCEIPEDKAIFVIAIVILIIQLVSYIANHLRYKTFVVRRFKM